MTFSKKTEITGHVGAIYSCVATKDFIYSASADKHIVRWFVKDGTQDKFAIKFDHSVYCLELIGDHLMAVGLSSGDLHFFDLKSNKEIKFFTQHKKAIFSLSFNSRKNQIYVGDAEGNFSIWDSTSLELLIYLPLDCGKIRSINVSSSGENFALTGQDGYLRIFESNYFNEISSFYAHENGATSVMFHPLDSTKLISGGKDALLKLWDWKNESKLDEVVAHTFGIYDLLSINNGENFISASRDKNVKIWNSNTFSFLQRLDYKSGGHKHSVNALSKINETKFVSCSDDKKMVIWTQEID
ncbi:MAG: hypothetical protein KC454_07795 [Flavobacteriales bacterium]|nr:hypothetical protein [Flavobacteriales bacterium]